MDRRVVDGRLRELGHLVLDEDLIWLKRFKRRAFHIRRFRLSVTKSCLACYALSARIYHPNLTARSASGAASIPSSVIRAREGRGHAQLPNPLQRDVRESVEPPVISARLSSTLSNSGALHLRIVN